MAESREAHSGGTIVTINVNGRRYSIPKSKMVYYAGELRTRIYQWVSEQKTLLGEMGYRKLMRDVKKWEGRV